MVSYGDWCSVRSKTFEETIAEYEIDAPSSYNAPVIDGCYAIDSLGLLVWDDKKGKQFDIMISNGLLAQMYVGKTYNKDTAMDLAKDFMNRYDTWAKVLNYIKKYHKTDLRTLKHSTC